MDNNTIKPTAKLEQMQQEVIETHNKIKMLCEGNEKLKNVYKGCLIYSSPIYKNPNILFFGINPNGKYDFVEKGMFEPLEINHNGYGIFWEEIKECLESIDKKELSERMVLTNRYFFATHTADELDIFFNLLKDDHNEIAKKQEEWSRTLINELSPKLIIAGGKRIWDKFNKLFPNNTEILEKGKSTKVLKINGIVLIIYMRNHNSIRDKEEFIKFLRKYTNEL